MKTSGEPSRKASRAAALGLLIAVAALGLAGKKSARHVEVTPDKVAAGRGFFATCAGCHGQQGEGIVGAGPRLNSETFLAAASDDFLAETITKGRPGTTMIPWGQVYQPEQVEAIIAYLRSLNPVEPIELDDSPLEGNAKRGEKIFANVCAACHGNNRGGYPETANGTGIGRKAFLDEASNGFIRHIVKEGKSQTVMRPFAEGSATAVANLTDQEVDDVIAYLRENAW